MRDIVRLGQLKALKIVLKKQFPSILKILQYIPCH